MYERMRDRNPWVLSVAMVVILAMLLIGLGLLLSLFRSPIDVLVVVVIGVASWALGMVPYWAMVDEGDDADVRRYR
jgi:hypothetical protein